MATTGEDGWPCAVSPFLLFLLALFRAPGLDIYLAVKNAKLACFHILEPYFWSIIIAF